MDYTIQRGDTLSAIAARMGTTVQALAQANGIANPNLIQAGATLRIPDQGPAPTTGAMPLPRPNPDRQVAAAPPLPVPNPQGQGAPSPPLPVSNPTRQANVGAPLPRPNPANPLNPGPPFERGAPMQVGRGPSPDYRPAGWFPVPGGPADPAMQQQAPVQTADNYARPENANYQRSAPPAMPDIAQLSYLQLAQLREQALATGQQLPPNFDQVLNIRRQQAEMEAQRAQQAAAADQERQRSWNMQFDAPAYRAENGTSPRAGSRGDPSIGEGEYLPAEMIRLGQLGANMQNAPQANTMLPSLGLLVGGQGQGPTLGQLARRTIPSRQSQPYVGV